MCSAKMGMRQQVLRLRDCTAVESQQVNSKKICTAAIRLCTHARLCLDVYIHSFMVQSIHYFGFVIAYSRLAQPPLRYGANGA
jgi:hypothetical protein